MAKKKDPFQKLDPNDPYGVKPGQSKADVPPPTNVVTPPPPQAQPNMPKPNTPAPANNSSKNNKDNREYNVKGLDIPLTGLSPKDAERLKNSFLNSNKGKLANTPVPLTHEQQVLADYQQKQADAALIASQTAPNATPDQLNKISNADGQNTGIDQYRNLPTGLGYTSGALESDILRLQQEQNSLLGAYPLGPNKIGGLIFGLLGDEARSTVYGNIESYPKLKEYLQDYSNKDNFKQVQQDVSAAQSRIKFAISLANQPGNSDLAVETYENAVGDLLKSERELKILSRDQKAYKDEVRRDQVALQKYLDQVLPGQNVKMRNALIKPDPAYFDTEVNADITGIKK